MDMDWRLIVAIFTGFIAKEVVIATLGVLYATSSEEGLVATMTSTISPATALAFLVITMLFIPCVGTVAAMRREAGTRWMLFGTALLLVVSYVFGWGIYEIACAHGPRYDRGRGLMLANLLTRVGAGGSVHLGELADELGVTVQVVRDMLTDLALRGYLKPSGGDCTTKCGGCAFASSCHGTTLTQTWTTDREGPAAPPQSATA